MNKTLKKITDGYLRFREKYTKGNSSVMQRLASEGQKPEIMIISCCDSRVDPALILQCNPGDLFTVRNIANIVPPFEADEFHHGTSAALEFGICYLNVKHLIILGHSQCGGIQALLNKTELKQNDFISRWVSLLDVDTTHQDADTVAKQALLQSYQNCLTFPWITEAIQQQKLCINLWFFDIQKGEVLVFSPEANEFKPLSSNILSE